MVLGQHCPNPLACLKRAIRQIRSVKHAVTFHQRRIHMQKAFDFLQSADSNLF